jgi:hypothetical protein
VTNYRSPPCTPNQGVRRSDLWGQADAIGKTRKTFKNRSLQYFEGRYRMRALGLILMCVILLAGLQASYLVIDAHKQHTSLLVTDDSDQVKSQVVSQDKVVVLVPQKQKKTKQQKQQQDLPAQRPNRITVGAGDASNRSSSFQYDSQDTPASLAEYKQQLQEQRKLCRINPGKCDRKQASGKYKNRTRNNRIDNSKLRDLIQRKKKKETQKKKNTTRQQKSELGSHSAVRNRSNTILQILHIHLLEKPRKPSRGPSPGQTLIDKAREAPRKEKNLLDLVQSSHKENSKPKAKKDDIKNKSSQLSIYDTMVGDSPMNKPHQNSEDLYTSHHQRRSKKRRGKTTRGEKRKERKNRKNQECTTSSECGKDECCVIKKSGRQVCSRAGRRTQGRRCTDTCLCQNGLQCFVSEYNSSGKRKKSRKTNTTVGKCTASVEVDVTLGFLLPKVKH